MGAFYTLAAQHRQLYQDGLSPSMRREAELKAAMLLDLATHDPVAYAEWLTREQARVRQLAAALGYPHGPTAAEAEG